MRLAVSIWLLLGLGPIMTGQGRELGVVNLEAATAEAGTQATQNAGQTGQAQKSEQKPLTNEDVLSMVKAGLAQSTIVLAIQHASTAFDTSAQALIDLHRQGVPQPVLDAMLTAGNSKAVSPAVTPASTPAKPGTAPPDLHKIRKVFLETEWADDDDVIARKVIAIHRRTCLQVVQTLNAADASLRWSDEGFTGAAFELHSKDGQVIWSRVGGFAPPFKALKQALGCPK